MATLLDERPQPKDSSRLLFGNSLVRYQEAQRQARVDAAKEARSLREEKQKQLNFDRLQSLREQALELRAQMETAKLEAANMKLKQEAQQLTEFQSASKLIGKLNPKDPDYEVKRSEIIADHATIFADTKENSFSSMLKDMMDSKGKEREVFTKSREAALEAARTFTDKHGIEVPLKEDGMPNMAAANQLLSAKQQQMAPGLQPEGYTSPEGVRMKVPGATASLEEEKLKLGKYKELGSLVADLDKGSDPANPKNYISPDRRAFTEGRIRELRSELEGGKLAESDKRFTEGFVMGSGSTPAAPSQTSEPAQAPTERPSILDVLGLRK